METNKVTEFCTGCRACEQLCAHNAITMQPNSEGFLEAVINLDICIECGLCYKRCPQNTPIKKWLPSRSLAVRDKDNVEIKSSASGGAFAVAARVILSHGGTVVGVAYNDDMTVSHIIIKDVEELFKIQSSKYVQSNTECSFRQVKQLLKDGITVLYSGTPCQIAGLNAFLYKDYDNLYTMDLICHGVASPKLFAKYLLWLGKKMNGNIVYYNFRDKSSGWGLDYMTKTKTRTRTKTMPCGLDPYYYHFLCGDTYCECCYQCPYACRERVGDITIGDYWGIEKVHPEFYSTKGVSCLLVNTDKGQRLWNMISNEFVTLESTFEKVVKANCNLKHPSSRPAIRDHIYDHIDDMPVEEFFTTQLAIPFNLKAHIKQLLPTWVKVLVKKYK